MSFSRRMRRKAQKSMPRPVIEITATDTHFHLLADEKGGQPMSLELALGILGYFESYDLSLGDTEHLKTHSRVPPHFIDEAVRMKGAYCVTSDSVLFLADEKWAAKAKGAQLTRLRDLD